MDASTGAKYLTRWIHALGVALVSLVVTPGCDEPAAQAAKEAPSAEPAQASAPAAEVAPAVPLVAKSSFEEEAFVLKLESPEKVPAGQEVAFKVVLTARAGYKVNDEYPIKFQMAEMKGVTAKKAVLKKEDAKVEKDRAEFPVVVTFEKAGPAEVGGKLSFSVCTEERCLIEKRDLSLKVDAS